MELGQGRKTVLAQIAAEALLSPLVSVFMSGPDTNPTPYDQQTSSSRTTFSMGGAIGKAAEDLKQQILEKGAELLEAAVNDLVLAEGRVVVRGSPGRSLGYGEIVLRSNQGNLIGNGAFSTRGGLDLQTGQGIGSVHWHQGAIACEVVVDVETGKSRFCSGPCVFAGGS